MSFEERAKNRAKRSASISSSSFVPALPTTNRNTGYSYSINPDDIPADGEDSVLSIITGMNSKRN
jgi:hypothetical protein